MKRKLKFIIPLTAVLISTSAVAHAEDNVVLDNQDKIKTQESVVTKSLVAPKKSSVPDFKKRIYRGKVHKEKVLVVLMDFSNSKNSTLAPSQTKNYHKKYDKAYYQNLFFGKNSIGPDGKKYHSLKTYYQQVSGNSLSLSGQVAGWYRAKYPLEYYGHHNDQKVTTLIKEAANKVAKDKSINMNQYDQYDYYDLDDDGNIFEPDGIIDKLVVVFSGVGESEGGGQFGNNSIWEHVSEVEFDKNGQPQTIPNTKSKYSKFYKNRLAVAEYGVLAEDSSIGTFSHEFGHMLGLIDEYDTAPSANNHAGEPVRYWSLMSYGADTGAIVGTRPAGLSPFAKSDLQQIYGGNWLLGTELSYKNITSKKKYYLIDQASIKGVNNDVVKINLPQSKIKTKTGTIKRANRYYLLEWRSHNGVDKGLSQIRDPFGLNQYGKGLLIWYVDESYSDNSNLVKHPGKSLVGVVDSTPKPHIASNDLIPMTDTQIFDAPFNTKSYGNYNNDPNFMFKKSNTKPVSLFNDKNYSQKIINTFDIQDASRVLPQLGIKIKVEDQNADGTVGKISVYK
ncbi:immune inhibitor A domain-containing protein [Macrococcus sp. DPC7161]|uniref:immune inhibitor A domain-containing protein n=1 Tax=Macrococcus sp. DPC7161 TaxID=2507060 RepID=UPI00100BC7CE|nr:immune inhibitor A domain-containing protein [Macrococcus sp. DPC7161]RXK17972.1 M6 family metalloprotease domain-containing protein [Macrococcus sp. DPC7161]